MGELFRVGIAVAQLKVESPGVSLFSKAVQEEKSQVFRAAADCAALAAVAKPISTER